LHIFLRRECSSRNDNFDARHWLKLPTRISPSPPTSIDALPTLTLIQPPNLILPPLVLQMFSEMANTL
jgi:hypothetical protein